MACASNTDDSGAMVSHTYASSGTFTVTLTVTDDDGASSTCTTLAVVNELPLCMVGPPDPTTANINVPIMFDGSASSDPDGTIVSYDWDFGDGQNGSGAMVSHPYAASGTYTVTLTVTDDSGATATCVVSPNVVITELPVCDAGGRYSADIFEEVQFDGSGSNDPDGGPVTFFWEFGDGETATGPMPTHTYMDYGDFTGTLTVTDDEGDEVSCSFFVTIDTAAGFAAYVGSEIELHCAADLCGGLARSMIRAVHGNSSNPSDRILALGFDPNNLFSFQNNALNSWVGPNTVMQMIPGIDVPVDRVFTPTQFAAVDLADYRMILVASYEGYIPGGLDQALLDAMNARAAEFEDAVLRRGVGLFTLCLAPAPDLVGMFTPPLIQDAFVWSPIDFVTIRQTYRFVCPLDELTMGSPTDGSGVPPTGFPPIMPPPQLIGMNFCNPNQNGSLGHQDWENWFEPVPADPNPLGGLIPLAFAQIQPPNVTMEGVAVIGGIPTALPAPPAPVQSQFPLLDPGLTVGKR